MSYDQKELNNITHLLNRAETAEQELEELKEKHKKAIKALDNLLVIRGRDNDEWADYNCVDRAMEIIAEAFNSQDNIWITCGLIDELNKRGLINK